MKTIRYNGVVSPWYDTLGGSGLTWTTGMQAELENDVADELLGYVTLFSFISESGSSVTLPTMQAAFDSGSAEEKAAFQSSVSGDRVATETGGTSIKAGANGDHLLIAAPTGSNNTAVRMHQEPTGIPIGLAAKLDQMFSGYDDEPNHYAISAQYTHNPDNISGGKADVAPYAVASNVKGVGDWWGIFPRVGFGFNDQTSSGHTYATAYYHDTTDTVWRTGFLGPWRSGFAVAATGKYMQAGGILYVSASTGTTGSTKPTHTAGTVSDGGVTWTFVRNMLANGGNYRSTLVFGNRDDLPKFGLPNAGVQFSRDAAFWNGKKAVFLDSAGASAWEMYTVGADLYIAYPTGTSYLRLSLTNKFIQFYGLAHCPVKKTSSDAQPDVSGCELLELTHETTTNITRFLGGKPAQFLFVRCTTGGVITLTAGTYIKLAGGAASRVLAADDNLMFIATDSGGGFKQVG